MKAVGLDIGTTSICAVTTDLESGEALQTIALPNDAGVAGGDFWERSQNPQKIAASCRILLDRMLDEYPDVISVGISGQMHGMLYVDCSGAPLGNLSTWQDGRGNLRMYESKTYAQTLAEATGMAAASGYGMVTLFYDSLNGLIPEAAAKICTIGDYVGMVLCGNKEPLIHISNAAGLGGFDFVDVAFTTEKLPPEISPSLLPRVAEGETVIGSYRNIPVCCAIGDNQAGAFGSLGQGVSALVNVGTGSQVSSVSSRPVFYAGTLECRPYVGGKYLSVGAALCGGYAYRLLRDFFIESAKMMGAIPPPPDSLYRRMDENARRALEEGIRLKVDTRFQGTRRDPSVRGSITGIGVENLTSGALCLGVLEGICDELLELSRSMRPPLRQGGILAACGNGIRNSPITRRILTERLGMTVAVPRCREEAAFGASLISAVAARRIGYDEASGLVRYD